VAQYAVGNVLGAVGNMAPEQGEAHTHVQSCVSQCSVLSIVMVDERDETSGFAPAKAPALELSSDAKGFAW
jgi:hypothetical protein